MDQKSKSDSKERESTVEEWAEIHELAKARFQEIVDFEGQERDAMLDDKAFAVGENNAQWDANDVNSRKSSGRSFLTIMRSNQYTDYVKNQQRQNKPSIKISPTDQGAQEEEATRRQGLIRKIQYESKASQARQAGFDDAVQLEAAVESSRRAQALLRGATSRPPAKTLLDQFRDIFTDETELGIRLSQHGGLGHHLAGSQ